MHTTNRHAALLNAKPAPSQHRSRSSPSPPRALKSNARDGTRTFHIHSSLSRRSKPLSPLPTVPRMDWSSSYLAGSSSSREFSSDSDSDEATADEGPTPHEFRGRSFSQSTTRPKVRKVHNAEDDHTPTRRTTFTRSRSPKWKAQQTAAPQLGLGSFWTKQKVLLQTTVLPSAVTLNFRLPWVSRKAFTFSMDSRKLGECVLLLTSLAYLTSHLAGSTQQFPSPEEINSFNMWINIEMAILSTFTTAFLVFSGFRISDPHAPPKFLADDQPVEPVSSRKVQSSRNDQGFIWMSVPKNYRDCLDDGFVAGMIMPSMVSLGLLHNVLSSSTSPLSQWLIEDPQHLPHSAHAYSPMQALVLARYNLVDMSILCSSIFILHVCASWWLEARHTGTTFADGERRSVPRGELRRSWRYFVFTCLVTIACIVFHGASSVIHWGFWQHLNIFDVIVVSLFYQFTLYVALRMAHRGFTLGELTIVCFGGTAIFMEFLYFTIARMWPATTEYIKTYRLPTPLLVYQMALIAGSFLVGFLLSPFLFLSRHVASRPQRRLRNPQENQRHKRFLALGFYIGALLIVGGPIGLWTRWCLGKRDPWLWILFWIVGGRWSWSRPALLAYWGLLASLSVAGWNRQLARSRKSRTRTATDYGVLSGASVTPPAESNGSGGDISSAPAGAFTVTLPTLPNLSRDMSNAANELLDAADKRVPWLGLNARRKFFHALAVVMFVPGIAFDPAFTHLAFNVCFALFTFAEYVRYFAVYPFGASVHVFMHDFLDNKDTGTAVLSHFLLLTGCAGSLWLESAQPIQNFTGTLVLGVGDAVASIVGKSRGKHRWSLSTGKTLEGSLAFVVSVTACAWLLRICGLGGDFELRRYFVMIVLSSLLEALSEQNDNLILPLYAWAMLSV